MQRLSSPDIQINTGAVLATRSNRCSLSRTAPTASFCSSTTAAKTMNADVEISTNSWSSNTSLMGAGSVKGPRLWTAPQIARKVTTTTEAVTPVDPNRNADHSKNGTRE